MYDHFGSKENLLLALMEEYLAGQVAEQLALFDGERISSERPLAGSENWMARLHEHPDRFRLFVELWTHAQRDERLRRRLAGALRDAALQPSPVLRRPAPPRAACNLQPGPPSSSPT